MDNPIDPRVQLKKMRERVGELRKFHDALCQQIQDGQKIIYDLEARIRDQRKGVK